MLTPWGEPPRSGGTPGTPRDFAAMLAAEDAAAGTVVEGCEEALEGGLVVGADLGQAQVRGLVGW